MILDTKCELGVYRVDIWVARPYRAAQMATRFPVRCDSLTSVDGQSGEFGLSLAIESQNVNTDSPVGISGRKRSESEAFHELVEPRKGGRFRTNRGHFSGRLCSAYHSSHHRQSFRLFSRSLRRERLTSVKKERRHHH